MSQLESQVGEHRPNLRLSVLSCSDLAEIDAPLGIL